MSEEYPKNIDAETWLLGSIFQDPKAMAQLGGRLQPNDFYKEENRLVWQSMQKLQSLGEPIDIVSVAAGIKKIDAMNSLFRKNDYLFLLMESVSSAANADYYAELIQDCASKRNLMDIHRRLLKEAADPANSAEQCIESALEALGSAAKRAVRAHAEYIGGTANETLQSIKQSKAHGKPLGIRTSFGDLDNITDGLRKGELTIVGARPGVGKTSFALDVAIHAACHHGAALMFSLEMSREQLAARAMCYHSKVSLKRTVAASLSAEEIGLQQNAAERLVKNVPLLVVYERDLTAKRICALAHSCAAKMPLSLVVIDHLQIIDTQADRKGYENRNVAIGAATRLFKVLSGKLNCPVIALSQLNRDMEKSSSKLPSLKDLRDSGNIEQDADCVVLLHRLAADTDTRFYSETDVIVAKNRSGPTGKTKIHFNTENAMFTGINEYIF